MKELVRLIICLAGLAMMSTLIADILKEWRIIGITRNPSWVIIPVLTVFIIKELTYSPYVKDNPNLPPAVFSTLDRVFQVLLVVLGILMMISVPFVWFGAIKATIMSTR